MASINELIKLNIRTVNNNYADVYLELSSSLTVYDLKQKIALNHPTKPIPKDQRLIFSGKLLDDSNLLNQIFIKSTTGSSFMIHLVLDSDKNASTPKTPQSTTVPSAPIVNEQSQPHEKPLTSHSSTYEQYSEELNKYQQQLQQFLIDPNANPTRSNYETQAYLQYCATHYQMYQNFLAYQRTVVAPSATVTTPIQQSATTTTAPPVAPQPAAGNNNNNNNDFEQENDLLGILNIRFLVVFAIFALLYLHCRGYLSVQRRRRAQVQPAHVVPEQVVENDGEQAGEDETDTEPVANEAQNQNDIQRQHPPPPPPGPVVENPITTTRLLITAVSTFFSSLIPERPQRA